MIDTRPTVFVIDDDISIRDSLKMFILSAGWQAELFDSAGEFLSRPRPDGAYCLLLDVNLPDLNGLDLQALLTENRNGVPIIFITGYSDIPISVRAMKGGAVDFLTKPLSEAALLEAIENALKKSLALAESEARLDKLRGNYNSLSPREQEVMRLVVTGLLNKQVAYELGITEITVKVHRSQVMRKMKARSLPALVNMVAELDAFDTPLS
jgi:FixJ family two-component response regulator